MIEKELEHQRAQELLDNISKDYKQVFSGDAGEKVLKDLEKFCGFETSSVNESLPNELQTFFAEGKRRVFLRILWYINRKVK